MTVFYDILFLVVALFYFPLLALKGKWHKGFKMRLGRLDPVLIAQLKEQENVWIHAVSVGEVLAVCDLISAIKDRFSDKRIVCSVVTKTGYALAKEKLSKEDVVIYAPLDFSWVVRRYIRAIAPKIYILTETELWPNILKALQKVSVNVIQINGRISDQSFRGYKKLKILTQKILPLIQVFCVQTLLDKDRLVALGADADSIKVVGNLKYDVSPVLSELSLKDLRLKTDAPIWVAGSTHPGEESLIVKVYQELKVLIPELVLIIAPRHIERTSSLCRLLEDCGLSPIKFSTLKDQEMKNTNVLVVDKIGHLCSFYKLATVVFVGKSLLAGGGQNVIEPALMEKPVLVGPFTENFREIIKIFKEAEAIIEVKDSLNLKVQVESILKNKPLAKDLGRRAKAVVLANQGATRRTLDLMVGLMDEG